MSNYNFETDTVTYKDHIIEDFFKSFPQQGYIKDYVKDNLICLYVGGSHAYGLDTDTSDLDIRGIFKDSIDMILGYQKLDQLANDSQDIVIYSLSKLLPLVAEGNPNVMECLWVDEEEILFATYEYSYLRSRREDFLSKIVKHKYSGYAMSQLSRIKGHDKWLVKEQSGKFEKKPNIKDYIIFVDSEDGHVCKLSSLEWNFNYHYFTKVKDEIYNLFFDIECSHYPLIEEGNSFIPIQQERVEGTVYRGIIWFNKSQFQIDLDEYNNWKKWKENRNETRHQLEVDYGYDTKFALHACRLMLMGIEILQGKGVIVKRPDRDFLLDVRNGKYTYNYIIETIPNYISELDEAYKISKLQNSVDKKMVVDLIKQILFKKVI